MGLDTGQPAIGRWEATLRIAVGTAAGDSEQMEPIGMDACRGRNRLQEVLRKPKGKIPVSASRYFSSVTQHLQIKNPACEKIINPLKLPLADYWRWRTAFSRWLCDAGARAICIVQPDG